jgi:glutamyl-tRNA reductase
MYIIALGINHHSAPLKVRERLSFSSDQIKQHLPILNSDPVVKGAVILSTCNRTEIYVATLDLAAALEQVRDFLSHYSCLDIATIKSCTYTHTLYEAVRHLFRVVSGLDSMIVGETEILGQVRSAYELAQTLGTPNVVLNTLFQQALAVGKKVRRETGIDQKAVSISYAAVELARKRFGKLSGCRVLVVGAGKMSSLAVRYMVEDGVADIIVANRSFERAEQVAGEYGGRAIRIDELFQYLSKVDIVISSTGAGHYVIRREDVANGLVGRAKEDLLLIDIAVPRDIEPTVGELPYVILYNVDDLKEVVECNLSYRSKLAVDGENIIDGELNNFMRWLSMRYAVPTITALKQRAELIKEEELVKAFGRLGKVSYHDTKVMSTLASSVLNQILHDPITRLKEYAVSSEGHVYTKIVQDLFNLDVDKQGGQYKIAERKRHVGS